MIYAEYKKGIYNLCAIYNKPFSEVQPIVDKLLKSGHTLKELYQAVCRGEDPLGLFPNQTVNVLTSGEQFKQTTLSKSTSKQEISFRLPSNRESRRHLMKKNKGVL